MNKILKSVVGTALLAIFLFPVKSDAGARIYVRIGPPRPKVVKVVKKPKPYRRAVWVSAHWKFVNGRYVWCDGNWTKARLGYVYIQPHLKKTNRGCYYVPGCWVKV